MRWFEGKFKETDACCRAHDQCPYFIDHFETKYNYHNPYPWTLSHCDCDNKLYSCLKVTSWHTIKPMAPTLSNFHCFLLKYNTRKQIHLIFMYVRDTYKDGSEAAGQLVRGFASGGRAFKYRSRHTCSVIISNSDISTAKEDCTSRILGNDLKNRDIIQQTKIIQKLFI